MGRVNFNAKSYYKITGLNTADDYIVNITANNGIDGDTLKVYQDGNFDVTQCSVGKTYGSYSCLATPIGNGGEAELYFDFKAAIFNELTIDVFTPPISEGDLASRIPLDANTALPYSGQVGGGETSYYQLNSLIPNNYYKLTLTGTFGAFKVRAADSGDQVFCDGPFASISGCIILAPTDGLATIDLSTNYSLGSQFEVSLESYTLAQAEGTAQAPKDLTNLLPYRAQVVGDTGTAIHSYYVLRGLTPGNRAEIEISDVDGQIYSLVKDFYANPALDERVTCSPFNCYVTIPDSGEIYMVFHESELNKDANPYGGYFTINIQEL